MVRQDFQRNISIIAFITVITFLIYYPVLNNTFISDDYDSLYRICIEKRILFKEYLRPMIDISFYFNYLISGFSAKSYYIFNLLVHVANTYLIYRIAKKLLIFEEKEQEIFAVVSCFLFLIYPFHNEGIVWLSGRLSSMACCCALAALYISLTGMRSGVEKILTATLFFIGLLCYESIIILPAIIIILNWQKYKASGSILKTIFFWSIIIITYFLIRYFLSGVVYGEYGERIIPVTEHSYFQKILKVSGRIFVPPMENSTLFVICSISFFFIACVLHIFVFKKIDCKKFAPRYVQIALTLIISLLIPFSFGVSTRTPEGDRLLYFPSCFLCLVIGAFLMIFFKRKISVIILLSLIAIFSVCSIEKNNRQWKKASNATVTVLETIKKNSTDSIMLINVPDELEGAYVFRKGLYKPLAINKINTQNVIIVNYLKRLEYLKVPGVITPVVKNDNLFIYPATTLKHVKEKTIAIQTLNADSNLVINKPRYSIYYWNKDSLIKLF